MTSPNRGEQRSLYERLKAPIATFARHKLAGGILLVAATVAALIWANSAWGDAYRAVLRAQVTVGIDQFSLSKPLLLWINDGLMGVFFFVVGLEIKREFLVGELSSLRKASLPMAAALGGVLAPAAIFLALNAGQPTANGWAIPMATDIAFCLGVLALLGDRVPGSLKVFLTALAIVDDIAAILVIAVFYTESISLVSLGLGGGVLALSFAANRIGVRSSIFYFVLGSLTWLAFLKSGVHATLAAVLMAFTIPARSRTDQVHFVDEVNQLMDAFCRSLTPGRSRMLTYDQQHILDELTSQAHRVQPPVQSLEHALVPLVTFLVLPVFALANAGVVIDTEALSSLGEPLALGIILGLFLGKQMGIFAATWLVVRTGLAQLPEEMNFRHIYGAAALAGIGFTMALFIGELAFVDPELRELSKMSILVASLLSGAFGVFVLSWRSKAPAEQVEPGAADS